MKFLITLIKFLGTLLLFALFGAFLYYIFINPSPSPLPFLSMSNLVLIVLILAMVVFALFSVFSENMLLKRKDNAAIKLITDQLKQINAPAIASENNALSGKLSLLLEQLSSAGTDTNKTLNLGIQQLNERIDQLHDVAVTKNDKLSNFVGNLEMIASQMSAAINSVQNTTPTSLDLSPITEKISAVEETFANFENQTSKSLEKLQNNMGNSGSSQENSVLMQKFDDLLGEIGNTHQQFDQTMEKLQNVVDGLSQQQVLILEQLDDLRRRVEETPQIAKDAGTAPLASAIEYASSPDPEVIEDTIPESTEEASFESVKDDVAETFDETASEEKTVADDLSYIDSETEVDTQSVPEYTAEAKAETSESEEFYENKATESEQKMQADDPFGVPVKNEALATAPALYTSKDEETYMPEDPFGQQMDSSLTADMPDLPSDINPNELVSDDPFGSVDESATLDDVPAVSTNISADDPFGSPVDVSDQVVETDNNDTFSSEMTNQDDDAQENLNKIFNDQFAADLADLDILKDEVAPAEAPKDEYEEIDLNALLGENNS